MDRLFEMYEGFKAKPLPTEVRAAWLHHRYVQIHPFQDGNGRTGRLLMAYEFARNHEFAPIIAAAEKPTYLDMMQASDEGIGGMRRLASYFAGKSAAQTEAAIVRAREVLRGRGAERKANGRRRVNWNRRQVYTGPCGNGRGDEAELRRAANAVDARAKRSSARSCSKKAVKRRRRKAASGWSAQRAAGTPAARTPEARAISRPRWSTTK